LRYLEQEPEREGTERILDRFEDDVVGSRSPSMSRLSGGSQRHAAAVGATTQTAEDGVNTS
jgi:hypothetical protein